MSLSKITPIPAYCALGLLFLLPLLVGCETPTAGEEQSEATEKKKEEEQEPILKPFDPPTLDELNAKVEWVEQPVLDAMELRREHEKSQPQLATVKEALAMKNDSPEANEKILSALGQMAPKDGEGVNYDATILRQISGDVKSTNPIMISSSAEFDVSGLTGIGLFGFDWNFKPFADRDTVVSWHSSKDRLYDKVVMRKDLRWSDGTPLTAKDIAFSFKTILNPKVPVPAVRSGTDEIRWVEAFDDYTIVYFHKKPSPVNLWNINFPIIPKHIYEKELDKDPTLQSSEYHVKYEQNPVVCGPYEIVERVRGQKIVLERRESFYTVDGKQVRAKPYFKRIIFRVITDPNTSLLALKSGEIEECILSPDQWRNQTDGEDFYQRNTKTTGVEWVYFYFGWNCESPFFNDRRVRQAMSYAFDHKEMLDVTFYGLYQPGGGVYHKDAWMYPKVPLPEITQDLDRAEDLLDAAGWQDHDGDGIRDKEVELTDPDGNTYTKRIPFEFAMMCGQTPNAVKVASILRESLDRIGVICHVRPTEYTVQQQRSRDHDFHAMMAGWGTGTDPYSGDNLWETGAERNYVEYSTPVVDELFGEGEQITEKRKPYEELEIWKDEELRQMVYDHVWGPDVTPDQRVAKSKEIPDRPDIYRMICVTLYRDQPYTWLYYRNSFYGFSKKLRGYMYSPRGPYSYGPGFSAIWTPLEP